MINLRMHKWEENVYMDIVNGWTDLFEEYGIEQTVNQAIADEIKYYPLLKSGLLEALAHEDRENLAILVDTETK